MAPSVAASPFGPLSGPLDVLMGSDLYEMEGAGQRVLMAVKLRELAHGRRLDIVGLVSTGNRLNSQALADGVSALTNLYRADLVTMCTQRAHIVRGCARHGWEISGVVMNLKADHVRQ